MSRFENLNKKQTTLLISGILLVIFIVLFSIAEIGVRFRHYLKYGGFSGIENSYKADEKTGMRIPIPGKTTGGISINSLGFRGPEIAEEKPSNGVRLAFLGASTTYCAEVTSNDLVWTDLVTQKLGTASPNIPFDYINGGVPGYKVSDSINNLKLRVANLHPDIVFIYHATNDLSFNTRRLAKAQGLISEKDNEKESLSWFSQYSLLAYLVEKNLRLIALQNQSEKIQGVLKYDIKEIIEPFEKDLRKLVDESKKTAKFVALITFSHRIRAEQSQKERTKASITSLYYMPYMTVDAILEGFDAYNDVIRRVAHEENVFLIDNNFSIAGDGVNFNDSVHFTNQGSEQMANRIYSSLAKSQKFKKIIQ